MPPRRTRGPPIAAASDRQRRGGCADPIILRAVSNSASARRRRLTRDAGQFLIDTCPRRCGVGPDRERRLREFRVIQCSGPEDCQVRSRLRRTRHRRSTALAELPVHAVAAVRRARIVPQRSSHRDGGGRKYNVYGCAPRSEILAVAAPADSGGNRIRGNNVPHRSAKASTCDCHRSIPRAYYTGVLNYTVQALRDPRHIIVSRYFRPLSGPSCLRLRRAHRGAIVRNRPVAVLYQPRSYQSQLTDIRKVRAPAGHLV